MKLAQNGKFTYSILSDELAVSVDVVLTAGSCTLRTHTHLRSEVFYVILHQNHI